MSARFPGVLGALVLAGIMAGQAPAPREIRVMTSGAFTAAHLALAPAFERVDGSTVVTLATSMGTGATSIETRLSGGEPVDLVIVDASALERFARNGAIVNGSRTDLVRSAIGMAIRSGAPKPDISTVEAFTRTLLDAPSIAYSASVSGTYLSTELFQRLGVADRVLPKSRRIEGERVGAVVARGEAAIGFQQMSELLPIAGIDVVGPFPSDVQRVTTFSAGTSITAPNPDGAQRYVAFLTSADARATIVSTGLEPIPNDRQH